MSETAEPLCIPDFMATVPGAKYINTHEQNGYVWELRSVNRAIQVMRKLRGSGLRVEPTNWDATPGFEWIQNGVHPRIKIFFK